MNDLKNNIESLWDKRNELSPTNASEKDISTINEVISKLDAGNIRVAEKKEDEWIVHEWVKKAVLLSFRTSDNELIDGGYESFYDKVPLKYKDYTVDEFKKTSVRVVPHAAVRKGSYVGANTVLMPSFVNIGAYIDEGCMIDTWATVGSCAQIGKNVHLSGGAGIGGVLEPLQASPTIIEDNCFIGARSEVVEGVIVEKNSVIAMGVFLGQSTKIYDRDKNEVYYGRVPQGSVVVPGTLPSSKGSCSLYCAVIVKRVDAETRAKTSINELLRS
jgi:2,3,4,5-tetrahydropyridine-2-carboxylate N-succinyltransferase